MALSTLSLSLSVCGSCRPTDSSRGVTGQNSLSTTYWRGEGVKGRGEEGEERGEEGEERGEGVKGRGEEGEERGEGVKGRGEEGEERREGGRGEEGEKRGEGMKGRGEEGEEKGVKHVQYIHVGIIAFNKKYMYVHVQCT